MASPTTTKRPRANQRGAVSPSSDVTHTHPPPPSGSTWVQGSPCLVGGRGHCLDRHAVKFKRRRHRSRIRQRLHHVATRLRVAKQPRYPLRGLRGIHLQMNIYTFTGPVHRVIQQRPTTTEPRRHIDARTVHRDLHHLPVPGNLGKQSETYRKSHVPHRRRRSVTTAQPLRLIAEHREFIRMALLAHVFQHLCINIDRDDPGTLPVIRLPTWRIRRHKLSLSSALNVKCRNTTPTPPLAEHNRTKYHLPDSQHRGDPMALLQPEGLIHGHYECKSLDETLPVFTDLLAANVSGREQDTALIRHPNTGWTLIVHEAGADAPDKPHANHYGFRVADHKEIQAAHAYIVANQERYGLTSVSEPSGGHFAYSIYISEPGGNLIELEYYNVKAAAHGRQIAAGHWDKPLTEAQFPGRGYIPQALSHGTAETDDKVASNAFYTEVLGLDIVGGGNFSTYIGHQGDPWYVVVLPATTRNYLRPVNRYTLKVASTAAVRDAYDKIGKLTSGITQLCDLKEADGEACFILSDLDRNWWEITSTAKPNRSPD
jgi:catechol 2,3-dioxygenase-like lactoylglutathione lyase family enzyme